MSKFKPRWNSAKPSIKLMENLCPYLLISSTALAKMRLYVEECTQEIGWLGSIQQVPDDKFCYIMDDVYLFDQEVHATTTEISPQGLSDFGVAILQEPNGMELWNRMCAWGHSHVNMGVTPSGQDDAQMNTFKSGGYPYFFRLICNKAGEIKVDMYDYSTGVIYTDIPWDEEATQEDYEIQKQIKALQKILDTREDNIVKELKTPILAEMKEKVKSKWGGSNSSWGNRGGTVTYKTYVVYPNVPPGCTSGWSNGKAGYFSGSVFYEYANQPTNEQLKTIGFEIDDKKKVKNNSNEKKNKQNVNNEKQISFFGDDEASVFENFSGSQLVHMANMTDDELEVFLYNDGWSELLDDSDYMVIKRVAKRVKDTYEKEISHLSKRKLKFMAHQDMFTCPEDVVKELGYVALEEAQGKTDDELEEYLVDEGYDDYITKADFKLFKQIVIQYGKMVEVNDTTSSTR